MQGKIIKGIGGFYYIHDGVRTVYECRAKGIFRNRDEKPLVGDDVIFSVVDEEKKVGRIDELLPRKNSLIRPAVANMDQALIVVTAKTPAFHPALLDHFLLWMEWQELPTLIGISKLDLDTDGAGEQIASLYRRAGYEVFPYSGKTGEGLPALRERLRGQTTVLAGASGVGKSSLLNALIPDAGMEIGDLSRKLERGRHTTRHSEIFFLEDRSFILDTPGFSSLAAPEIEESAVRDYFPEFAEPAANCRFPDCVHIGERDCGIKEAVRAGRIAQSRYDSYRLIYEERKSARKY